MTQWRLHLLVGTGLVLAYPFLPGTSADVAYLLVGVLSVAALVVGALALTPAARPPWYLLAAGQAAFVAGDAVWTWLDLAGLSPFPSAADVLYLAGYPLLAAGMLVLLRRRRHVADVAGVVDGAIVTLALGLLVWVVLAAPTLRGDGTLLERAVAAAYPAGDVLLVAILAQFLLGSGGRTVAFRLLVTGLGLLLVADAGFAVVESASGYEGGAFDLLWLASYVVVGTAGLHPSAAGLGVPATAVAPYSTRRLLALGFAVLVAPLTLVVQLTLGVPLDAWAVAVASTALFGLVVARMDLAIRAIRASSEQRDRLRENLAHLAAHDALTGLANRSRMVAEIRSALHRACRSGSPVGLLFVDLDHFKDVNDTYGHAAGDEVLRVTAGRLQDVVRAGDTVGRIGGDEFVVLVEHPESEEGLVALARRVVDAVGEPVRVGEHATTVGASVGVALARDGSTDPDRLLHEADAAAYRAKSGGRGRAEVFDEALSRELVERGRLESALRAGIAAGELVLHYQPILDTGSGEVAGYEALVRWDRPGHGLVAPADFIPVAERSTLVCDVGRWVLAEATAQLVRWTAEGRGEHLTVSVNLSGRHVAQPGVVTDVADALAASGLAPHRLALEITETVVVDVLEIEEALRALRDLGVRISIDDFGTGYTSIHQLQHLAVDTLKIDRSLVEATTPGVLALVGLVVQAAHAFDLTVVAEGVEEPEQLERLRALGCDSVQGFLFARPEPAGLVADDGPLEPWVTEPRVG
ncbi:putative bifunctional diguanylate cyclase/phosphodiesterase [Cellulomonas carbonis]|uniref:putative bifunctional diguanylate cyclase/phosphodiesterase n=1 Tax=Cellulomonas carbonis TaxID=1386092 RepID=UPI000694E02F|nr:EAL domain-containing protein [Cellulomonas carbonis]GGB99177.1 hypothetical protein GCM10010972_10010 [Cellulomonas carbonis]